MNSVTWPSTAPASPMNLATSAVRSRKPRPEVCAVSSDDTIAFALTTDKGEREGNLGVMNSVAPSSPRKRTRRYICKIGQSDLAADVFLHPVGHLDQPPPRLFEERHDPVHVAVAGQRDFDLAFALGRLRLGLFQRVRFRQRLVGFTFGSRRA